jgi:hypothetical protein
MSHSAPGGSGGMSRYRSLQSARGSAAMIAGFLVLLAGSGCGEKKASGNGSNSSPSASALPSPSGSSAAPPTASASVAVPGTPPASSEPVGDGVSTFVPAGQTEACKAQTGDIATYLQRGEVTIAGQEGSLAASWLIKLGANRPGAQLAFAGFALDAKQLARARGIGMANETAPRIFASGSGWTLVWSDSQGLAFTKPRWETAPPPQIEHVPAVSNAAADDVALAATPAGAIVAVAPFNVDKSQLGLFLFAPSDPAAPQVQALGATHHAKKPGKPAVAADAKGYTLAWHEEDGRIAVSRFDLTGKESDEAYTLATKGPARERVHLTPTTNGAVAIWIEGEKILARAVDADARPKEKTYVVGKGRAPALAPLGDGALVVFLGQDGSAADQLLAVKLGPDGAPSAQGLRVSETGPVKDPAAATPAGPKMAFLWVEPMNNGVATKRAILRTIEAACVP